MTPIQTNKPVFFNSEGEPLNGTIYIGQPDSDPRTNPKTVTFRDAGGVEFTASQPLRTTNGRIVYNGKPIVALVDGEYSMLVFDSSGAQVDYSRSVEPAATGGGGSTDDVTKVGLTLSEIKGFDVAVGDVIENVGLNLAEDGKGGKWIVKSSTGATGDNVFLIDLDNGLQASRVDQAGSYPKLVWSGSATSVLMSELDDGGSGIYIVNVSGATGVLAVNTEGLKFSNGLLELDIGSEFFVVRAVRYSPVSGRFTAISNAINDLSTTPTTSQTDLTITEIYKV